MKKRVKFIGAMIATLIMASCMAGCYRSEVPDWLQWLPWLQDDPALTCNISFAKTVDERYQAVEWYKDDEFTINTKIYVIVEFTIENTTDADAFIDFKIQIPHAKYYSTHEYSAGVVEPKEEIKTVMTNGMSETMVELSDMVFNIRAGRNVHYTYCFTIEGNSVCENAQFNVVFTSDDGVIIPRNMMFFETYSFVED